MEKNNNSETATGCGRDRNKPTMGSKALRAAMDRVDVIVCAHLHKQRGKIKDGAWIINPGYAAEGQAAIIDLDTMDVIWIDSVV